MLATFGEALRGDVLEVGAGIGNFTRWLHGVARRVVVAEPDGGMCEEIRRLGLGKVEVVTCRMEELDESAGSFDSALLVNVLEHLPQEGDALAQVARLLRRGGNVCILVPAHPMLFGSLDRRYEHLRRYTAADVGALLVRSGFTPRLVRYFNPLGAVGWLLASRLARCARLTPGMIRSAELIAVPLGKGLEKLGDPPFGQSVIAVGEMTSSFRPPSAG